MSFLKKLAANKRGATAIEYALIAALIAVVAGAGLTTVGTNIDTKLDKVAEKLV